MNFRLIALVWAWMSAFYALVCLVRLGFDEWPVVIKHSKWSYVVKVITKTILAGLVFWGAYR